MVAMSKGRTLYVITAGSHDDYHIVTHLQGRSRPAMSTLRKQFEAEYGIVREPAWYSEKPHDQEQFEAHLKSVREAFDKYGMWHTDLFVHWLIEKHGFTKLEVKEVNL